MGGNVMHAMTGMSGMSGLSGLGSVVAWSPLSLPAGRLRQYSLDGGASYEASPLNGLPMLRSLEPYGTYRQPRQGRAWLFDGTDDFADASNNILSGANAFTFTAWVRLDATGTFPMIISSSAGLMEFRYQSATRTLSLTSNGPIIWSVIGTIVQPLGVWTHCSATFNNGSVVLYVNGVQDVAASVSPATPSQGPPRLGARGSSLCLTGAMRDVRIYNVAKNATQIASIAAGNDDTVGLLAQYPCSEESGTVGFDISGNGNHLTLTNITQSTFHAADAAITSNRNNRDGFRLSSGVYIPKRLNDANAADGNALTVTGQSPYPVNVEVPCITGNGTDAFVDLGLSGQYHLDSDWSLSIKFRLPSFVNNQGIIGTRFPAAVAQYWAAYAIAGGVVRLQAVAAANVQLVSSPVLGVDAWYTLGVSMNAGTRTITGSIDGVPFGSVTVENTVTSDTKNLGLLNFNGVIGNARLSDLQLTKGGVTTHFPLQDGPGSSNTNRDLSFVRSDGTYGIVSNAIVNGTVSTIWANRCPNTRDWCIEFGGDIAANGAFLPGQISGSLASDGTAKTLVPGKFGNPFSRINFNPHNAAELNGLGLTNAYAVGAARQSVAPIDTKFRRTRADGDNRFLATSTALTGIDKTNVEGYVS